MTFLCIYRKPDDDHVAETCSLFVITTLHLTVFSRCSYWSIIREIISLMSYFFRQPMSLIFNKPKSKVQKKSLYFYRPYNSMCVSLSCYRPIRRSLSLYSSTFNILTRGFSNISFLYTICVSHMFLALISSKLNPSPRWYKTFFHITQFTLDVSGIRSEIPGKF